MRTYTKQLTLTLKNIDPEQVENKYNLTLPPNITPPTDPPTNTTRLTELNTGQSSMTISFLDDSKKSKNCFVTMIDFSSKRKLIAGNYSCYWCRHPFTTYPIGCPIRYIPTRVSKTYKSHISKDVYTIGQHIPRSRISAVDQDDSFQIDHKDYYETDGIFCSFNCCKAFIDDNKHNRLYDGSNLLLTRLYNTYLGTKVSIIDPAPHWRLLREYGGVLSIEEFRKEFNNKRYEQHGTIVPFKFRSIGTLFEEKLRF